MADNSLRTPGSGETIRTVDKSAGAFKVQTVQIDQGVGTAESLVTTSSPLTVAPGTRAESLAITTGTETTTITSIAGYVGVYLSCSDGLTTFVFSISGTRDGVSVDLRGFPINNGSNYETGAAHARLTNDFEISEQTIIFVPLQAAESFTVTGSSNVVDGTLNMLFVRDEPPLRAQLPMADDSSFHGEMINALYVAQAEFANDIIDVSLASGTTSAELVAATAWRLALFITNTDENDLYLRYGATAASATVFTFRVPPGALWEMPQPIYKGAIQAIWAANGSGSAIGGELQFN